MVFHIKNMENVSKRKTTRLSSANYSATGSVFLTICTKNRRCLLSTIVGTGVPDGPFAPQEPHEEFTRESVGTGVPDGPFAPQAPHEEFTRESVGTGVPDGPRSHAGTGVPDGPIAPQEPHEEFTRESVGTGVPDGPRSHIGTGVPDGPFAPLVELLPHGKIAEKYIKQLNNFYQNISVDAYVIMPNHIHLMLSVKNPRDMVGGPSGTENGPSGTPVPTEGSLCGPSGTQNGPSGTPVPTEGSLCGPSGTPVPTGGILTGDTKQNSIVSKFISTFKRFCNKEYRENIWQYRSYDHIIRSREDYEKHLTYMFENPLRWQYDELFINNEE